jgi:hypothetical protein
MPIISRGTSANLLPAQHHHLRTCSAAVKKARAFEIQKTVKKLKTATEEERATLESQLQALKGSNHGQVAAIAIKSKLVKARLLPRARTGDGGDSDEQYPLMEHIDELEAALKAGEGSSAVNMEEEKAKAKLLSNKMVSEEVSSTVNVISALLRGEEPTKQIKAGDKAELRDRVEVDHVSKKKAGVKRQRKAALKSNQEAESAGEGDTDLGSSDDDYEESEEQKANLVTAIQSSLTAQPSKRKNGIDEQSRPRPSKQLRREIQDSESEDDNSNGETNAAERLLPALSTGFVGGRGFNLGRASEDEWSDGDAELESIDEDADGNASRKEARKNRMGQRARRA